MPFLISLKNIIFAKPTKRRYCMKKTILVITGSPRKGGNSDLLAEALISGAKEAGHEILRFDAGRKNIGGCKACNACFSKGVACVFEDDFLELAPMFEQADVLVLSSPLYFYSFTAQIKAAIDKMYSLYVGERPLKIKDSILLACGETDDVTDFDGIIKSYELIVKFLEWNNRCSMIVPNVNEKGEIKNTNALEEAVLLGKSL